MADVDKSPTTGSPIWQTSNDRQTIYITEMGDSARSRLSNPSIVYGCGVAISGICICLYSLVRTVLL